LFYVYQIRKGEGRIQVIDEKNEGNSHGKGKKKRPTTAPGLRKYLGDVEETTMGGRRRRICKKNPKKKRSTKRHNAEVGTETQKCYRKAGSVLKGEGGGKKGSVLKCLEKHFRGNREIVQTRGREDMVVATTSDKHSWMAKRGDRRKRQ